MFGQFLIVLVLVVALMTITPLNAFPHEENLRSEVDYLRNQIREKKDAGDLQGARALQDQLREKISRRYPTGEDTDYDSIIQERIRSHQEERRQSHKARYSSSSGSRKKGKGQSSKFSDSRALHQMDQSNRKADILRNKVSRGGSMFTSEEIDNYHQRIQDYLLAEEKVAESLQATSDDFNKARSMRDKTERLNHLEGAKTRKQKRHEDEYKLREISRQKFFSLNDELDSRLNRNEL